MPQNIDGDSVSYSQGDGSVLLHRGADAIVADLDGSGFAVARVGPLFSSPLFVAPVPDGSGDRVGERLRELLGLA